MDVFEGELVDERQDTGCDGGFPDCGDRGVGANGGFVLEDDAIELRDVELVGGGA